MRTLRALGLSAVLLSACPSARAEPAPAPRSALGFITGAAIFVAGFGVGGVLLSTSGSRYRQDNAGWLTIESGFTLAPLAAHAVTNEWARGLAFATAPAAMTLGTIPVFAIDEHAVRHGPLSEQRVMWSFFTVALFTGAFGVVDSAFAGERARGISVMPIVGRDGGELTVSGTL